MSLAELYEESYPPSLWGGGSGSVPSTGAVAGLPGTWTPLGSQPPDTLDQINAGWTIAATPQTPWTAGQWVEPYGGGYIFWDGTAWQPGKAPLTVAQALSDTPTEPTEEPTAPAEPEGEPTSPDAPSEPVAGK